MLDHLRGTGSGRGMRDGRERRNASLPASLPQRAGFVTKLLILVTALVCAGIATGYLVPLIRDAQDFRAFYCAGSAVAAHRDPYLAEPLRTCEAAVIRYSGASALPYLSVPAPLPGYALAAMVLFAVQPYAVATATFGWLLVLALGSTTVILHELTGIKVPAIFAALILSGGWVSLINGQLAPIVLCLLCASALALKRGRPVLASLCAASAMLEPHVALPVCLGLAISVPRTRPALGMCAAGLAITSLTFLGWQTNVEYLLRVLPAHALAESAAIGQYSLTSLGRHFGVGAGEAVLAGDVSYVVTASLGLWAARRLYAKTNAAEFLVLVPAAFALFAGPFMHLSQMVVAVPALLLLWRHFPERRRVLGVGLILIAIPWQELLENGPLAACVASGAVGFAIAFSLFERFRPAAALACSVIALAGVEATIRAAFPPPHGDPVPAMAAVSAGGALADATWSAYERLTQSSLTPWYLASHLPTWSALTILVVTALSLSRKAPFAATTPAQP